MTKSNDAEGRAEWIHSSTGTFALHHQGRLFQHLIADWPRRGHTLLEVGCGGGLFLEMMWALGFDVTGLDSSMGILDAVREQLGCRVDLQLGAYDALPYDDHAFDYVALLNVADTAHSSGGDVYAVVREALRVATKGVILGCCNNWSLARLAGRVPGLGQRVPLWPGFSPWYMVRMVRALCPDGKFIVRSVLPGPPRTWRSSKLCNLLNGGLLHVPIGAYMGIRIDLRPYIPLTGLPLLVKAARMPLAETVPLATRTGVSRATSVVPPVHVPRKRSG